MITATNEDAVCRIRHRSSHQVNVALFVSCSSFNGIDCCTFLLKMNFLDKKVHFGILRSETYITNVQNTSDYRRRWSNTLATRSKFERSRVRIRHFQYTQAIVAKNWEPYTVIVLASLAHLGMANVTEGHTAIF